MPTPELLVQYGFNVHVKVPRVFRYMEPKFIDEFFKSGKLRLGSLARFRGYKDEVRGDPNEGKGSVRTRGPNNNVHTVVTVVGENGYVFCTSIENSARIGKQFGLKSAFVIDDPMLFTASVARSIPGVAEAFVGPCNYQDTRTVETYNASLTGKEMLNEEGRLEIGGRTLGAVWEKTVGSGIDLLFLKKRKYQTQAEYRFIWTVNTQFTAVTEFLDITCKEAVQYCSRVESLGRG